MSETISNNEYRHINSEATERALELLHTTLIDLDIPDNSLKVSTKSVTFVPNFMLRHARGRAYPPFKAFVEKKPLGIFTRRTIDEKDTALYEQVMTTFHELIHLEASRRGGGYRILLFPNSPFGLLDEAVTEYIMYTGAKEHPNLSMMTQREGESWRNSYVVAYDNELGVLDAIAGRVAKYKNLPKDTVLRDVMRGHFTGDMSFLADVYHAYRERGREAVEFLATVNYRDDDTNELMINYFTDPESIDQASILDIKNTYTRKQFDRWTNLLIKGIALREEGKTIRRRRNHLQEYGLLAGGLGYATLMSGLSHVSPIEICAGLVSIGLGEAMRRVGVRRNLINSILLPHQ